MAGLPGAVPMCLSVRPSLRGRGRLRGCLSWPVGCGRAEFERSTGLPALTTSTGGRRLRSARTQF